MQRRSLILLPFATMAARAATDSYPSKPVTLIVSYAAGNATDVVARLLGQRLSRAWKQPVIIDNRPGQGGSLGAQQASKAAPDGYTLLVSALAAMAINPHLYSRVGYDAGKDFIPIAPLVTAQGIVYARADLNVRSIEELVQLSKSKPGGLNYGSPGNGTVPHLSIEMLKARTGLVATHVPYKASGAILQDVVGGRLDFGSESTAGPFMPLVKAGKLTALATFAAHRLPRFPDLPTISEIVPGITPILTWLGIFAPAATPRTIVEAVHAAVSDALREAGLKQKLLGLGLDVLSLTQPEFAKLVSDDRTRMGTIVRELKLKVD